MAGDAEHAVRCNVNVEASRLLNLHLWIAVVAEESIASGALHDSCLSLANLFLVGEVFFALRANHVAAALVWQVETIVQVVRLAVDALD